MMSTRSRRFALATALCAALAATPASALNYVVVNVNNAGAGSLRQAITNANANPGPDTISFNIGGAGPYVIPLAAALPVVTSPVTIDGLTQPGAACPAGGWAPVLQVVINGGGIAADGLSFAAGGSGSVLRGVVIQNFNGNGVVLTGNNNSLECNFIGTNNLGMAAFPNAANGVRVVIQSGLDYTPTPVISHAILTYNQQRPRGLADGVVITPSHNPAEDGGFKYNPPEGGPADTAVTKWIQDRANALLADGLRDVRRITLRRALAAETTEERDYITPYVADLAAVVDMDAITAAGLRIGVDPMGGSGVHYWAPIAERYGLNLTVVNPYVDPTFGFMTVDHDGKIRMDCSSPYAMASLIRLKDDFDIAFGNDPDFDRHGIVTRSAGLMNPNHFLAVTIWYLFQNRPAWRADAAVGKER